MPSSREIQAAKINNIRRLLADPAWRGRAVRAIAKQAGVSPHLVRQVMQELGIEPAEVADVVTKWGTVARMDTSKIGRRPVDVKLARALGRIGSILRQYRGLSALAPLREAYRQVAQDQRRRKKEAG